MTCNRMETDGMRYIDGEMSADERAEFERHAAECGECRRALDEFHDLAALTRRVKMKDPTDEFWDQYWKSIYRRIERRTAWIFILVGTTMLFVYHLYRAIESFGRLTFNKIALVVVIVGLAMLLVSVIRERVHQLKVDKYKDIQR